MSSPDDLPTRTTAFAGQTWHRLRPHLVFLILVLGFGLAVLAANPPFQAPDEWENYYRAFQVSEGIFVGQKIEDRAGGPLPASLGFAAAPMGLAFHPERKMTRALWDQMAHPLFANWSDTPWGFFDFRHTVLYAPVGYAPQALGIVLGRLLSVGNLGVMYLARLAGFTACVVLGYAALRRVPLFRWSLLLLLLAPMSLYLMGSVAQDGVLTGGAALLTALLARLAGDREREPGRGEQMAILGLAATLPFAKFVYLPLAALAPLVVLPRLSSARTRIVFGVGFVLCCLAPVWAWSRVINSLYVAGRGDIPLDPVAQLHQVARDPAAFLRLLARSVAAEWDDTYRKFIGVLGWVDTWLPRWFYGVYGLGLLGCVALESAEANWLRWWHRVLALTTAGACVVLVYLAMYSNWNAPGSRSPIDGIQGRYFLPLAPLLFFAFPRWEAFRPPVWAAPLLATTLGAVSGAVCLWAVIARYYLP